MRGILLSGCLLILSLIACAEDGPTANEGAATIRTTVSAFEEAAADITVRLFEQDATQPVATQKTNDHGVAVFSGLRAGRYDVAVELTEEYALLEGAKLRRALVAEQGKEQNIHISLILLLADIDGNRYRTTQIADQVWTAENLRVTRFRNGDPIPEVQADADWKAARENEAPAWSYYKNDPTLGEAYGKLYNNFAAADARGICPDGWHVPTDEEVQMMERSIGVSEGDVGIMGYRADVAGKLMSTRTQPDSHPRWQAPNAVATNTTGFSMLPLGFRNGKPQNTAPEGMFQKLGVEAEFYTSTPYSEGHLVRGFVGTEEIWKGYGYGHGLGVRCLRD